jgi:fermentation-respiration switch protein FrsA (DUF1100 family)
MGQRVVPLQSPPPRTGLQRQVRTVFLVLAALVSTVLGVAGWIGSERAIHPPARHYAWRLADYPDLRPQTIGFDSRTHVAIAGSFFPGSRRTTIVLSHGYGDNQEQMLPYAEFLHQAGFTVFTYDMRNRGRSGGGAVTLGALEAIDLISTVDYLMTRGDIDKDRLGALGVSLGAATTLLAAASDTRIKAVVDDSGFSDAPGVIATSFEHFIGLPAFPFAPLTVAISEFRAGVNLRQVRPIDVVGRIGPRPLFIIHCMPDRVVPVEHSKRMFEAAKEPKLAWWIPTGGHIQGHVVAPHEYERRVIEFLDKSLR